jgi:hypothetical protein
MGTKNIIIAVVGIVVVGAGAFALKGSFSGKDSDVTPGTGNFPNEKIIPISDPGGIVTDKKTTDEQTNTGGLGKMTDDMYVEISAWTMYYAGLGRYGEIAPKRDELYNKYGITQENMDAYGVRMENDPNIKTVLQKQSVRVAEIKAMGK